MHGIRVDNVFYRCKDAQELNSRKMRIVLIEGKNREIRRVFESREIGIKSLTRVRIGSVSIGDLEQGQFRDLTAHEIKTLKSLCSHTEKKEGIYGYSY